MQEGSRPFDWQGMVRSNQALAVNPVSAPSRLIIRVPVLPTTTFMLHRFLLGLLTNQ